MQAQIEIKSQGFATRFERPLVECGFNWKYRKKIVYTEKRLSDLNNVGTLARWETPCLKYEQNHHDISKIGDINMGTIGANGNYI